MSSEDRASPRTSHAFTLRPTRCPAETHPHPRPLPLAPSGYLQTVTHSDASNPTPSTEGALPVPTRGPDPGYPRNASGETYGSAAEAWSPDQQPDLILVMFGQG